MDSTFHVDRRKGPATLSLRPVRYAGPRTLQMHESQASSHASVAGGYTTTMDSSMRIKFDSINIRRLLACVRGGVEQLLHHTAADGCRVGGLRACRRECVKARPRLIASRSRPFQRPARCS